MRLSEQEKAGLVAGFPRGGDGWTCASSYRLAKAARGLALRRRPMSAFSIHGLSSSAILAIM